jgi:spore coat polysaccharide biosynthesis protein SpsF
MGFNTEQELFWAGEFGNEYISRNNGINMVAGNIRLFSDILKLTRNVNSVIEFGSNIGMNLLAIKTLLPDVEISAVEINKNAFEQLGKIPGIKAYNTSALDFKVDYKRNLSLVKGVLIHINPDYLQKMYEILYNSSDKYICIAEYYNPIPVEIPYRGHEGKLFKRDFAGEMLKEFPDLKLLDYGFIYHGDNYYKSTYDDLNWFLLEK